MWLLKQALAQTQNLYISMLVPFSISVIISDLCKKTHPIQGIACHWRGSVIDRKSVV